MCFSGSGLDRVLASWDKNGDGRYIYSEIYPDRIGKWSFYNRNEIQGLLNFIAETKGKGLINEYTLSLFLRKCDVNRDRKYSLDEIWDLIYQYYENLD